MTPTDLSAAAAAMGKRGGKSTSEAKRAASRENGKRGGRPKKSLGGQMNTEKVAKKVREDGEQCSADDVQRLIDSLDADGKQWLKNASAADAEKWAFDVLINSQPPV